jgi:hypothetical protein
MVFNHWCVPKSSVFWDIMILYSSESYIGMYHLHLEDQRISEARSNMKQLFLWNISSLSTAYMALYPWRWHCLLSPLNFRSFIQMYGLQKPALETTTIIINIMAFAVVLHVVC